MNPFEQLAQDIGQLVVLATKKAFTLQGHRMTGNLINSIDYVTTVTVDSAKIEFLMLDYGLIQNKGVPASNIPYSPGSGAGSSKYIDGLKLFARLKFGAGEREAERIAFAIANKHKREGMPTKASFKYSQTGKRTGAIEEALSETEQEIQRMINLALEEYVNTAFIRAFSEIN